MNTYVALLRGINVGGANPVKMADLRRCVEDAGGVDVITYLQSGNVIFRHPGNDQENLREAIEESLKGKPGDKVAVLIRSAENLSDVVRRLPFTGNDVGAVYVTFLSRQPRAFPHEKVMNKKQPAESYLQSGREIFLRCPGGYGKTRLSNSFFEKELNVSATTRNWRTVTAIERIASIHPD